MGFFIILIFSIIILSLGYLFGKYLFFLVSLQTTKIETKLNTLTKTNFFSMSGKKYFLNLIFFNLIFALTAIALFFMNNFLVDQNIVQGFKMSPFVIVQTVISFITNTNLISFNADDYVNNFNASIILTPLMFCATASGIAACFAFMRGITSKEINRGLGNFYQDLMRILFLLLIPLAVIGSLLLVLAGVIQNLNVPFEIQTINGETQTIAQGAVASFEAIKTLGTNGGSYFNANALHPVENPTLLSNFLETIFMTLISVGLIFCYGFMIKNKKQSFVLFFTILGLFAFGYFLILISLTNLTNYTGQELRFYPYFTSLFMNTTTAFSVGAINAYPDAMGPIGIFVLLFNMLTSVIFGGAGVGFINIVMYMMLTIYLVGLMVGHSPEFNEKRIELKEIKSLAIAIFLQPLIILLSLALMSIYFQHFDFEWFTAAFYQLTSATANNGSSMVTLNNSTMFFISLTSVLMLVGRYIPIFLMLQVSYSLSNKKITQEGKNAFKTDTFIFSILLIIIIIIISLLTFIPLLVLGPLAPMFVS